MPINYKDVVKDFEKYVELFNIELSKEAIKTIEDIEEFSYKCNYPCRLPLFFSKSIRNSKELQRFFYCKGINSNLAALQLEISYYNLLNTTVDYQRGTILYSSIEERQLHENTAIVDKALQICVKAERSLLHNEDIFEASMNVFESTFCKNKSPQLDEKLTQLPLTLSHVSGYFDSNLMVSFIEMQDFLHSFNTCNL